MNELGQDDGRVLPAQPSGFPDARAQCSQLIPVTLHRFWSTVQLLDADGDVGVAYGCPNADVQAEAVTAGVG
ncbi:hypothetical protein BG418_04885 [Streptomyces sp. CBMA152]|nr:hypothetical protein [Streptomyces sp. CBMA152]